MRATPTRLPTSLCGAMLLRPVLAHFWPGIESLQDLLKQMISRFITRMQNRDPAKSKVQHTIRGIVRRRLRSRHCKLQKYPSSSLQCLTQSEMNVLPCVERCHQHPFSSIPCSHRRLRTSEQAICKSHPHADRCPLSDADGYYSASRRRDALLAMGAALSSLVLTGRAQSQVEAQTGGKVGGTGEVTSTSSSFPEVHPLHFPSMPCTPKLQHKTGNVPGGRRPVTSRRARLIAKEDKRLFPRRNSNLSRTASLHTPSSTRPPSAESPQISSSPGSQSATPRLHRSHQTLASAL